MEGLGTTDIGTSAYEIDNFDLKPLISDMQELQVPKKPRSGGTR